MARIQVGVADGQFSAERSSGRSSGGTPGNSICRLSAARATCSEEPERIGVNCGAQDRCFCANVARSFAVRPCASRTRADIHMDEETFRRLAVVPPVSIHAQSGNPRRAPADGVRRNSHWPRRLGRACRVRYRPWCPVPGDCRNSRQFGRHNRKAAGAFRLQQVSERLAGDGRSEERRPNFRRKLGRLQHLMRTLRPLGSCFSCDPPGIATTCERERGMRDTIAGSSIPGRAFRQRHATTGAARLPPRRIQRARLAMSMTKRYFTSPLTMRS